MHVEVTMARAGYSVPVPSSATVAFLMVQTAAAKHAAYYVEQAAPATDKDRLAHYQKMCDSACKALAMGEIPGLDTESSGAQSVQHGFGLYASPVFSRDMTL